MAAHRCPPHCHHCPDMCGDVMPKCMGTAALALDPRSLHWCTCSVARPAEGNLTALVHQLEGRVIELERKLADLTKES